MRRSFSREPDLVGRVGFSPPLRSHSRARRARLQGRRGHPETASACRPALPAATPPRVHTRPGVQGASAATVPPRPEAAASPPDADAGALGGAREAANRETPAYKPHVDWLRG